MARYKLKQRDRAQAKQARELAKAATKMAKGKAAPNDGKPPPAETLRVAFERR